MGSAPVLPTTVSVTSDCEQAHVPNLTTQRGSPRSNGRLSPRALRRDGREVGNDEHLMRVLHDQHAQALWNYVVSFTGGDRTRAQDIVQETLLRAWRTPAVLDQSAGSARSWLLTVARRILIDEWRSSRSRPEVVTDDVPEVAVADGVEHLADRQLVVTALARLSEEHRQVLLETYIRGSSVAEAALRLGVPPGTIKSRTHYAMHAFKLAVEELGGTR